MVICLLCCFELKLTEAELSEQLENPTNEYRYRDLKGEDPD